MDEPVFLNFKTPFGELNLYMDKIILQISEVVRRWLFMEIIANYCFVINV